MAYQTVSLPSFGGMRMDLCEGLLKLGWDLGATGRA